MIKTQYEIVYLEQPELIDFKQIEPGQLIKAAEFANGLRFDSEFLSMGINVLINTNDPNEDAHDPKRGNALFIVEWITNEGFVVARRLREFGDTSNLMERIVSRKPIEIIGFFMEDHRNGFIVPIVATSGYVTNSKSYVSPFFKKEIGYEK